MSARIRLSLLLVLSFTMAGSVGVASAQTGTTSAPAPIAAARAITPPDREYLAFVASEGNDQIALLRFGPHGISVERTITTGIMPADVDGPHGVAVSPDGRFYYVTTAHGTPYGYLWKYSTANDSLAGRVMLGSFPATAHVSPDGAFVYVVNFNLHGEMVPSSVSVVSTDEMVEVARVTTCTMPHGSRLDPRGTKQYSACMMDDVVVEIDAGTLGIARHFQVSRGEEHGMPGPPMRAPSADHAAHATASGNAPAMHEPTCSPTWVQPSADGKFIFVACNKSSDIVEIDVARWMMTRRIPAGGGVYNLGVTHDGRLLLGTNKRDRSVSIIDIASGREVARVPTSRRVASGLAITSDDRYAFITQEGVGSEPGTVDVIDLRAFQKVATIDVGQQAGGIDFWKSTAPR